MHELRQGRVANPLRIKPDWWTRKALDLLKRDHVFVVTYHHCPFAWARGYTFVRRYGIYSTRTGMRVWGFERVTFAKVKQYLGRPAYIPATHEPKQLRRGFPPDMVYTLK